MSHPIALPPLLAVFALSAVFNFRTTSRGDWLNIDCPSNRAPIRKSVSQYISLPLPCLVPLSSHNDLFFSSLRKNRSFA
ncbi:hypothetical protein B0J11DRAFT_114716 [Dendryphion nanum]|uniref:Secreted protein n=1 Tax=Dendryphion nanum TaxID=256645 RepID=A0A9P9DBM5_9PLEO|nr:hypothetical protein B0J11DRAFT_114716 [Dendryphion nanum]